MEWGELGSAHRIAFSSSGLLPNRTNCCAPRGAPSLSLPAAREVMEMDRALQPDPQRQFPVTILHKGRRFTSFPAPGMVVIWRA